MLLISICIMKSLFIIIIKNLLRVQFVHHTVYHEQSIKPSLMNKSYRPPKDLLHTTVI